MTEKNTEGAWYREQAARLYPNKRGANVTQPVVEVDAKTAEVSMSSNRGAWVQAWVWIPDPPTSPEPEKAA